MQNNNNLNEFRKLSESLNIERINMIKKIIEIYHSYNLDPIKFIEILKYLNNPNEFPHHDNFNRCEDLYIEIRIIITEKPIDISINKWSIDKIRDILIKKNCNNQIRNDILSSFKLCKNNQELYNFYTKIDLIINKDENIPNISAIDTLIKMFNLNNNNNQNNLDEIILNINNNLQQNLTNIQSGYF